MTILCKYDDQALELVLNVFARDGGFLQDGGIKKKSPAKTSGTCKAPAALC